MIRLIEAKGYRCLRSISTRINPFEIVVGPNASGKSTFLDVVRFMGDLVSKGFEETISERSSNLADLIWQKKGSKFKLAVEMGIPDELIANWKHLRQPYERCRYEIAVGTDHYTNENSIVEERVLLLPKVLPAHKRGVKFVVTKLPGGNVSFIDEIGRGRGHHFQIGAQRCALANLPEDETKFPVSTWLKKTLNENIQYIALDSTKMRNPSPRKKGTRLLASGSNLPWVIKSFKEKNAVQYKRWLAHIQTALSDIHDIETIVRPEDEHCYLMVKYENGPKIPSWMISDGTLRLLALTLIAYLDQPGIYLIEEPENGIHPQAVETVFQSLSSAYEAQILLATHSPLILSMSKPEQILCLTRTDEEGTEIIRGTDHPLLREWKRSVDLGTLFAAGVLG